MFTTFTVLGLQIFYHYYFLGKPRPSLEWWIQDGEGEKLLLHTEAQDDDNNLEGGISQSFLDYGPLGVVHK